MAFENLKSTGIAYLLGKIKTFLSDTYVKIADSVRTVNDVEPDANGNIKIDTVQYAQNLESESSQRNVQTFIQRTSGGTAPIESGDGWLMLLKGNSVHSGYVAESINLTVTPAEREEGETAITATIDRDTFVAYVEDSGTTTLVYSTAWSADPSLYGITVTGTPVAGDVLTVVYVKEERGTITVAEPNKFVSTGWNLYDNVAGYAKVVKYEYGYMITGTYTSAKYAATPTGTQVDITITDGAFNIPDDGYIIVTGGNSTNTAIFPYWTDWTDGYDGDFAVYSKDEIDLSGLFGDSKPFPYGLLKVGDVADEIDLNIGVATSRIDRMAYSAENLATAVASGRAYEYDEDYIYIVRASAVVTSISVDGAITSYDHGIEYFTDTEVPVYAELLYGNNLKNKLETNVLTISQQTLSSGQKSQVKSNLGFANQSDLDTLNSKLSNYAFGTPFNLTTNNQNNYTTPMVTTVYDQVNSMGWCTFIVAGKAEGSHLDQILIGKSGYAIRNNENGTWSSWVKVLLDSRFNNVLTSGSLKTWAASAPEGISSFRYNSNVSDTPFEYGMGYCVSYNSNIRLVVHSMTAFDTYTCYKNVNSSAWSAWKSFVLDS